MSFVPTKVTPSKAQGAQKLPTAPNYEFRFMHHNTGFDFVDGDWLPFLRRYPFMPGADGVRKGDHGHVESVARREQDGWKFVPLDAPVWTTGPDGKLVQDTGYLVTYEGYRGPVYTDVWSHPVVLGSGPNARVDWDTHFDHAGFAHTKREWRRLGLVWTASAAVIADKVRIQKRRSERNLKLSVDGNRRATVVAEKETAKLAAMEATAKKPLTPAAPTKVGVVR